MIIRSRNVDKTYQYFVLIIIFSLFVTTLSFLRARVSTTKLYIYILFPTLPSYSSLDQTISVSNNIFYLSIFFTLRLFFNPVMLCVFFLCLESAMSTMTCERKSNCFFVCMQREISRNPSFFWKKLTFTHSRGGCVLYILIQ